MSSEKIHKLAGKFANVVFGSAGILFAIVFIYTIVRIVSIYYGSSQTLENDYIYFVYMLVALGGIGGCFGAFKLPDEYKMNLALCGVSIVVSLYGIELFLFFLKSSAEQNTFMTYKRAKAARSAGVDFDMRSVLDVVLDFEEDARETVPYVVPHHLISDGFGRDMSEILPLAGVSQKTTVYCNEGGEHTIYESDEHGFNNPYGIFSQSDIEIALIGDSLTQGACVKPGEDIGNQLRKKGNTVINLGIAGSGPLLELAILKEYSEALKPEIVLWVYGEFNDISDMEKEKQSPLVWSYFEKDFSQGLIDRQREVDRFLQRYIERKKQEKRERRQKQSTFVPEQLVKLWHLRMKLGLAPSIKSSAAPSTEVSHSSTALSELSLFKKVLEKAMMLTASWGGKLYFVYIPTYHRYAGKVEHGEFFQRDQILSLVQSLDIPVIDTHEMFVNHPDPLSLFPFRVSGHFNEEGYRLVVDKISEYLGTE